MTALRFVFAFAVSLLLANAAIAQDKKANKLPELAQTIFDKAESFELYSLQPELEKNEKPAETLQGWKVLGKTVLKGRASPRMCATRSTRASRKATAKGRNASSLATPSARPTKARRSISSSASSAVRSRCSKGTRMRGNS